MLELHEEADGKIIVANLSGKLTKEDYKHFLPEAERLIRKHGEIRVLCKMNDYHGWEAGALWEDIKFDIKHFADIERLALVGHQKWEAGMAVFCKPFTKAKIRHFERYELPQAEEWIRAGHPSLGRDYGQEASEESFPASDAPAY